jgi:hypothetical protein
MAACLVAKAAQVDLQDLNPVGLQWAKSVLLESPGKGRQAAGSFEHGALLARIGERAGLT